MWLTVLTGLLATHGAKPTGYRLAVPENSDVPPDPGPISRAFRLSRAAYIAVPLLIFGTAPLAFGDDHPRDIQDSAHSSNFSAIDWTPRALLLIVPLLAAIFIARTATFVSPDGIRIRAAFGSRRLPWSGMRGLTVSGRSVYAVIDGGAVRLPCVGVAQLSEVARASNGHIPQLRDPVRRFAPARRRR
jgi:hypothetical protein